MQPEEWFRQRYAVRLHEVRTRILEGVEPVFIRMGPDMLRMHRHISERRCVLGPRYLRLKEICHIPVAAFLCLSSLVGCSLGTNEREQLGRLRSWLMEHRDEGDEQEDARAVLSSVLRFVDDVHRSNTVRGEGLEDLGREIRPLLRACIQAATRLEIAALHRIVEQWTAQFDPDEWSRLHVVICASHQARYKEPTKLYFQRRLDEDHGSGAQGERRIIYAENASSLDEAVELLAVHRLDRELGAFFLDSPTAMQENILGDAARVAVGELLGARSSNGCS